MDLNTSEVNQKVTFLKGAMALASDLQELVGHYQLKDTLLASMKQVAEELTATCNEAEQGDERLSRSEERTIESVRLFLGYDLKYPKF